MRLVVEKFFLRAVIDGLVAPEEFGNRGFDCLARSELNRVYLFMSGHLVFGFFTGQKTSHQLFKQHLLNIWKKPAFHSRLTI